jgi:lysophospholipase L1-like esterase
VAAELKSKGAIGGLDATIYIHHALLDVLEQLAQEWKIPLVDNVALVDAHPESLVTQVHLNEEANARLAEAMYAAIEPMVRAAVSKDASESN